MCIRDRLEQAAAVCSKTNFNLATQPGRIARGLQFGASSKDTLARHHSPLGLGVAIRVSISDSDNLFRDSAYEWSPFDQQLLLFAMSQSIVRMLPLRRSVWTRVSVEGFSLCRRLDVPPDENKCKIGVGRQLDVLRQPAWERELFARRQLQAGFFGPGVALFNWSIEPQPGLFVFNDVEALPF